MKECQGMPSRTQEGSKGHCATWKEVRGNTVIGHLQLVYHEKNKSCLVVGLTVAVLDLYTW